MWSQVGTTGHAGAHGNGRGVPEERGYNDERLSGGTGDEHFLGLQSGLLIPHSTGPRPAGEETAAGTRAAFHSETAGI